MEQGLTPLLRAILTGNQQVIDVLCSKASNIEECILQKREEFGDNALDFSVYHGQTSIFSKLLLTLFEKQNIDNYEKMVESGLFAPFTVQQWLKTCSQRKFAGLESFILKLDDMVWKQENFGMIKALLSLAIDNGSDDDIAGMYNQARHDQHVASYLFSKLKKETLIDISKTVNRGLLHQECGFNDSWMFLSRLVNSDGFDTNLEQITKDCLSQKHTNVCID